MRILKQLFFLLLIVMSIQQIVAQNKQGNTANAEIFADSPYRMRITDSLGHVNAIPISIFAHDGDAASIRLMSIDIRIKSSSDTNFSSILVFDSLSDTDFGNLLINRSPSDANLDIQDFNNSDFQKSASHTIEFKETHDVIDSEDYVVIDSKFWYFTLMIPAEALVGYDDIVDIHIYFNIDWSVDDETSLRIFRKDEDLPKLPNWYRGDTHYHTMYTQNLVETGEAMSATKQAGQYIGLDWQFATDHSCDLDNYGVSMDDNWNSLGNEIEDLNNSDSSYIFIRGMEMSVKNSEGKIVHALIYPSAEDPFSLPYMGDGGGDSDTTAVFLSDLLDSLGNYNGICYAAHPFAELDKLPDLINGNVWNINDNDFLENGQAHPSNGTIICNNLTVNSDIFSDETNKLFKDNLIGFQIWNLYNTLTTESSDNFYNPWNIAYDIEITFFNLYDDTNDNNYMYRFNQGMDVMRFLFKKSLQEKNLNQNLQNWKTYISAGSDAHGSFNYSNTNMYYANYGTIENNALGKLSTLVYCPNGMGENGGNVISALKKGRTIISDGPVISMGIDVDNDLQTDIFIGSDTSLSIQQMQDYNLIIDYVTNTEFGDLSSAKLYFGTELGESSIFLNFTSNNLTLNIYDLVNAFYSGNIPTNEYFYFRVELETYKEYGSDASLYKLQDHYFHSYSNPIWIKKPTAANILAIDKDIEINISQNYDNIIVSYKLENNSKVSYKIYNTLGQEVLISKYNIEEKGEHKILINKELLPNSFYIISINIDGKTYTKKFIY